MASVKYLSPEWLDEAEKVLKAIPEEKVNKGSMVTCNYYEGCPDGRNKYLFVRFENGQFTQILLGEGEPSETPQFGVNAPYETWVKVAKRELSPQKGLMSGKLKLRGSMIAALKMTKTADAMGAALATIPTEY
jgi:putative sterol carrier protein